jgi:7,8-dihydroneopterin aldolase/epimerase/oxygenase
MDRLLLEGMVFFGRHGLAAAERELGARFTVDVELCADLRAAGLSDQPADTVDYSQVYQAVREVVEGEPRTLLESVAERIAARVLSFDHVEQATVRVHKRPPLDGEFRAFGVEVIRTR